MSDSRSGPRAPRVKQSDVHEPGSASEGRKLRIHEVRWGRTSNELATVGLLSGDPLPANGSPAELQDPFEDMYCGDCIHNR